MFATTHCFTLADVQADGERLAVAEGATVGAAPLRMRGCSAVDGECDHLCSLSLSFVFRELFAMPRHSLS